MTEQGKKLIAELEETGAAECFDDESICVRAGAIKDTIALLKAQEPVRYSSRRVNRISLAWTCGKCGADLEPNNIKARYCSNCGKAVKWDD